MLCEQSVRARPAGCRAFHPLAQLAQGKKKPKGMNTMRAFLRPLLGLSLFAVAACDELAVADDPAALAELRATKSCVRAVNAQTGASNAVINTTLPIIETNQYIVDVPGAPSWTCFTDDAGQARQLVELRRA